MRGPRVLISLKEHFFYEQADARSGCGVWIFFFFWGFHDISKGEVELRWLLFFEKTRQVRMDGTFENRKGTIHPMGIWVIFFMRWAGEGSLGIVSAYISEIDGKGWFCLSFFKALRIVNCGKIEDGFLTIIRLLALSNSGFERLLTWCGKYPKSFPW